MAEIESGARRLRPITPPRGAALPAPILSPSSRQPGKISLPNPSLKSGHLNLDTFSPVNKDGSFEFDRVLKTGKVHRRIKKKGAWKPSWKPAFLVLRPNLLSIYLNEDESRLSASITLSDVTAVAPVKKTHTDNVFGVFSPSKNYHFQGISAQDTADWITHIRNEARVDVLDEIDLPSPTFAQGPGGHQDDTTESGDEDATRPTSPKMSQWSVQGQKARSRASTAQRRTSHLNEYSGNEMTTSHSDFSDVQAGSLPKSMASSLPHTSILTPIASDQNLRPAIGRNASQLSGFDVSIDPERVIRQGWLQVLKTKGGVKQWKTLWVVLRAKSLTFYKNEQEYSAIKLISMSSIIDAAEIDPISKSKAFCFQIILEDKTFKCCAVDEDSLARWLGAMKSVLAKRQERQLAKATASLSVR